MIRSLTLTLALLTLATAGDARAEDERRIEFEGKETKVLIYNRQATEWMAPHHYNLGKSGNEVDMTPQNRDHHETWILEKQPDEVKSASGGGMGGGGVISGVYYIKSTKAETRSHNYLSVIDDQVVLSDQPTAWILHKNSTGYSIMLRTNGAMTVSIRNNKLDLQRNQGYPNQVFDIGPMLPSLFTLETYGIHGQGRARDRYYIGMRNGQHVGIVSQEQVNAGQGYILEIHTEEVEGGVALKVMNYREAAQGKSYYLPALDSEPTVYVQRPPVEKSDDAGDFISLADASKLDPIHYLRHQSFSLHHHPYKTDKVYLGDATWRFHEVQK